MGDHHSAETWELQRQRQRQKDEEYARFRLLGDEYQRLSLDEDSMDWILNHIDCFGREARLNESVEEVYLWPHDIDSHDDEVWEKLGQAVGNLRALKSLHIYTHDEEEKDAVLPTPNL